MPDRTCSIDECAARHYARGWCRRHYDQWHYYGDPEPGPEQRQRDKAPPNGLCALDECGRKYYGRGWCWMHYKRWRKYGDPNIAKPRTGFGVEHPQWAGTEVGYPGVHSRLQRRYGRASDFTCLWCDHAAAQWAYDHDDKEGERLDPRRGLYTSNLDHYIPLCNSCHKYLDNARRMSAV